MPFNDCFFLQRNFLADIKFHKEHDLTDMMGNMSIKKGIYRHFKGNKYKVIGVATHSESNDALVVYQPLYGDYGLWVRPLQMFLEKVELDGQTVSRFEYIEHSD
jgi:hypothetical protein